MNSVNTVAFVSTALLAATFLAQLAPCLPIMFEVQSRTMNVAYCKVKNNVCIGAIIQNHSKIVWVLSWSVAQPALFYENLASHLSAILLTNSQTDKAKHSLVEVMTSSVGVNGCGAKCHRQYESMEDINDCETY